MKTLECGEAEGLLWAYVRALGALNTFRSGDVRAIRSRPVESIGSRVKRLEKAVRRVHDARQSFLDHAEQHGCC